MRQESHSHRGSPVFGVFVLGTGVVLLLNVLGVLSWEIWRELWRWWPLLLVLAGAAMILKWVHPMVMTVVAGGAVALAVTLSWAMSEGKIGPYNTVMSSFSEPVGSAKTATLDTNFGAGSMIVTALGAGSSLLLDADFEDQEEGVRTRVDRNGNDVRIELRNPQGIAWLGPSGGDRRWEVRLNREVEYTIGIDGGASSYDIDLTDINSPKIDLNIGASSLDLKLPDRTGHTDASIDAGAASINVIIPDGIAAKIKVEAGLSSVDIDESRFPKVGRDHVSPDYDAASNRVNLVINAGVSSISVH